MGWQDGYLIDKVQEGDRVGTLELLAIKLARKIDTTSDARTIAAMTKQLREILEELDELRTDGKPDNKSQENTKEPKLYAIQGRTHTAIPGSPDKDRT